MQACKSTSRFYPYTSGLGHLWPPPRTAVECLAAWRGGLTRWRTCSHPGISQTSIQLLFETLRSSNLTILRQQQFNFLRKSRGAGDGPLTVSGKGPPSISVIDTLVSSFKIFIRPLQRVHYLAPQSGCRSQRTDQSADVQGDQKNKPWSWTSSTIYDSGHCLSAEGLHLERKDHWPKRDCQAQLWIRGLSHSQLERGWNPEKEAEGWRLVLQEGLRGSAQAYCSWRTKDIVLEILIKL